MGTRRTRRRQEALWVATTDLPQTVAHPFYRRVNALLDAHGFDAFVERQCQRFYAATRGRPSLTPGIYFRALLVGYFEGIDSERGIAWRAADSLAIRRFLGIAVDEAVPDHSTISRTRRLMDVETHRTVFTWVQQRLVASGVLKGATIGIDATTLEANAAMRSIVRRDTGEAYQAYLTGLAQASGIATALVHEPDSSENRPDPATFTARLETRPVDQARSSGSGCCTRSLLRFPGPSDVEHEAGCQ